MQYAKADSFFLLLQSTQIIAAPKFRTFRARKQHVFRIIGESFGNDAILHEFCYDERHQENEHTFGACHYTLSVHFH
jgi:hypothetical protein